MDSNIERWYSMKEICEYLASAVDTVLDWIERRNMPSSKNRNAFGNQNDQRN